MLTALGNIELPFCNIQGFVEARAGTASFDKQKIGYSRTQFVPMTFGFVF